MYSYMHATTAHGVKAYVKQCIMHAVQPLLSMRSRIAQYYHRCNRRRAAVWSKVRCTLTGCLCTESRSTPRGSGGIRKAAKEMPERRELLPNIEITVAVYHVATDVATYQIHLQYMGTVAELVL